MKIEMPDKWAFSTEIEVRVTDLNYGNHLANQQFLAYAQEARVRFFATYGFTELDFGGVSLIQADAAHSSLLLIPGFKLKIKNFKVLSKK